MMSQYIIHMAYYHYFLKPVSLYLIYVIVIARGFLCYICLHKAFNSLAWVHLVYSLISRSLLWIDFSINNKQLIAMHLWPYKWMFWSGLYTRVYTLKQRNIDPTDLLSLWWRISVSMACLVKNKKGTIKFKSTKEPQIKVC